MTYRWLTDLDQALAAAGLPYVEVGPSEADYTASASWRERGRPASTGEFDPTGVLCHHTASPAGTSDQADLNGILWGNSQAPGPVSSLYLGRTGVLYVVAAGRCNHGGQGKRPGLDAGCADMNRHTLGIEAGNSGVGEYWADAQIEVYAATVAALCSWYGWGLDRVWLHATTGPPTGGATPKSTPPAPGPSNLTSWGRPPGTSTSGGKCAPRSGPAPPSPFPPPSRPPKGAAPCLSSSSSTGSLTSLTGPSWKSSRATSVTSPPMSGGRS